MKAKILKLKIMIITKEVENKTFYVYMNDEKHKM